MSITPPLKPKSFQTHILKWFDLHGRKDLPWQAQITPYRVWISEIMLQQTQVTTVIPYFQRFIAQFPTIDQLAAANEDAVLNLWTGLGYYARARNLHKSAKIIATQYQGQFPQDIDSLQQLPGIGRSTAGAIMAIAYGISSPILDGNVKRVLSRFALVDGWYGIPKVLQQLWALAEYYTPKHRIADYTQAMMDLGAMICTRSKPLCQHCPLQRSCLAYQQQLTDQYPAKKTKKPIPHKKTTMLILQNAKGQVLIEKRPTTGIWGGLWCFPQYTDQKTLAAWCQENHISCQDQQTMPSFRHTFTHFHLQIHPIIIHTHSKLSLGSSAQIWYNPNQTRDRGFPAPITHLLSQLTIDKSE